MPVRGRLSAHTGLGAPASAKLLARCSLTGPALTRQSLRLPCKAGATEEGVGVSVQGDDEDLERLPPPHPRFAAHFKQRFYDADDARNDDLPPFGNDEGSDEVHEWAGRLDELQTHPTLRHMLGEDADGVVAELRTSEQADVDDILIGTGFSLLRFTGQIDAEGRAWLRKALERQRNRPGSPDIYAAMVGDLDSFESTASDRITELPAEPPAGQGTPSGWVGGPGEEMHPLFAAHFADPMYSDQADPFAPFGSDLGASALAETAVDRATLARGTLARALKSDFDFARAEVAEPASKKRDVVYRLVIGYGFALLRLNGALDDEGRQLLTAALQRQQELHGTRTPHYVTMLNDLGSFPKNPPRERRKLP